jgi:hypothetical protein
MPLMSERNTLRRGEDLYELPVKADALIHQGALVVLSGGFAAPAHTGVGLIAMGRAEATVDNTDMPDGEQRISVRPGLYLWANSTGPDALTQADAGQIAYIVDDQTVAKTHAGNTRSLAGRVLSVDAHGVWVQTRL